MIFRAYFRSHAKIDLVQLHHTPLLNSLKVPSKPRTTPGSYGCKKLNNQCFVKNTLLKNQTMSKTFCGRHYFRCIHHGVLYLKTKKEGINCCVCLKQMKRKLGKAARTIVSNTPHSSRNYGKYDCITSCKCKTSNLWEISNSTNPN